MATPDATRGPGWRAFFRRRARALAVIASLGCPITGARGEEGGGVVMRSPGVPTAFSAPSWARWNAVRVGAGDRAGWVSLSTALARGGLAIAQSGGNIAITMRVRFDPPVAGARLLLKVGDGAHGYACGYDGATQELVFGLKSATSFVMRAPFAADGQWRDIGFRFSQHTGGSIFVDGVYRQPSFEGGHIGAALGASAPPSASVGAVEGQNPLAALEALGAGAGWAHGDGANPADAEIAYLHILRVAAAGRALEIYFNEGDGDPVDYAGGVLPALVGGAEWTTVEQPTLLRRWPMQTPGDEQQFGAYVTTDENGDPLDPQTTMPLVVNAPEGGKALRCRVFTTSGRHSEWRIPVPYPTALDTHLAFDVFVDSETLLNAGAPYVNWMHWLRVGEGPIDNPALFIGHYDDDYNGAPGVRIHVAGTVDVPPTFESGIPLDRWTRVLMTYRAGRDGLGRIALADADGEWASLALSKNDTHQFRLRMRSDGTAGTIYFRNVAMGTDANEVMFEGLTPIPTQRAGTLVDEGGCVILRADNGARFAVGALGGFGPGDRVSVFGVLADDCAGACAAVDGCFETNTIGPLVAGCGVLAPGEGGCLVFNDAAGETHLLENPGIFGPGDPVFVSGRLGPPGAECAPGLATIVDNGIWRCVELCGELAPDAEGCPVFVSQQGVRYLLENAGGFPAAAQVRVQGRINVVSPLCGGAERLAIEGNTIAACSADLNGDGSVNAADLAVLLGAWGQPGSPEDLTGDGVVGAADLAALLGAWG